MSLTTLKPAVRRWGAVVDLVRVCSALNPTMGPGACSVNGCPCRGYENTIPKSEMCNNCGHQYRDHW